MPESKHCIGFRGEFLCLFTSLLLLKYFGKSILRSGNAFCRPKGCFEVFQASSQVSPAQISGSTLYDMVQDLGQQHLLGFLKFTLMLVHYSNRVETVQCVRI